MALSINIQDVPLGDCVRIREAREIEDSMGRLNELVSVFRSLGHEVCDPQEQKNMAVATVSALISRYSAIARKLYGFSLFPGEGPFIPMTAPTTASRSFDVPSPVKVA